MTKNLIDKKIKKNFRNRPLEEDQMTFQDLNVYRKNEIQDNHLKDSKKVFGEMPIFSDIEFSICGLCNRTCVFCPRANPKVYPNKKEYLSIKLFSKIINELVKYNYSGLMSFSGFSEPFMHKKLFELVKIAKNKLTNCKLEITTNGDILNVSKIRALYKLKLNSILVSMYDGPHQITYFEKMIKQAKVGNNFIILRKRYLSEDKSFGINLSNRGGMTSEIINTGILKKKYVLKHKCFYTHYRLMIDHDGNVLLCSHDWTKKVSLGDLNKKSIYQIWTSKKIKKYRLALGKGNREFKPCNNCNVLGTLQGRKHYQAWNKYYS